MLKLLVLLFIIKLYVDSNTFKLRVSLAQIEAGNNSYKLKKEIRKIVYS